MSNPTIKDVANEAGVSIATVSRVLNKNASVNDKLVEKVNLAVKKLGYYPNFIARTLKNDSSKTVGFVVSDIANNFFTSMARAIEDVLTQHGYNLFVCSTDDNQHREEKYLSLLREKQVDGIIINTSGKNNDLITTISNQIPIALFSRKIPNASFKGDLVDNDNYSGLYDLTQHLISLGHRRIGLINGQPYVSSSQERFDGFQAAMRNIGINVDKHYPYLYNGHFNRLSSGYEGAQYLYNQNVSAVIAANNLLALGALQFCKSEQIAIPDKLSLCSFGSIENHELLYTQPTYTDQSPAAMGARLAQLIIERIEAGNEIANREIRFATNLIVGTGTASISSSQ